MAQISVKESLFMLGICLLFAGLLLTLNGVNYFAKFDGKILGIVNLTGASILFLIAVIGSVTADAIELYAAAAASFVFAMNFIIIGLHYIIAKEWRLFGWFALFGAVFCIAFGLQAIIVSSWLFVFLWFMWAELWAVCFLDSAANIKWASKFTPFNLIINAVLSTGVPAILFLLGVI